MRKAIKKYGPLAILVLLLVVFGYLMFFDQKNDGSDNKNSDVFESNKIDTKNWKTHTDEEHGFSIKYPETFDVHGSPGYSDFMGNFYSLNIGPSKHIEELINPPADRGGYAFFSMVIVDNDDIRNVCPSDNQLHSVYLSGLEFDKCVYIQSMGQRRSIALFGVRGDKKYSIESNVYFGEQAHIIDAIINSIKFE